MGKMCVHLLQGSHSFRFYAEYFYWVAGDSSGAERLRALKLNLQVMECMSNLALGKLLLERYESLGAFIDEVFTEKPKNYSFSYDL